MHRVGPEAVGSEGLSKACECRSPHGFGAIDGNFPAAEVDAVHLLGTEPLHAKVVGEVGGGGHLCPMGVNGPSQCNGRSMKPAGLMITELAPR